MLEGLHAGQVAAVAVLVAAFVLPGVRAVARWDRAGRFSWPARIAIGYTIAFGAFSALTGPLILAHRSSRSAWILSVATWALAALAIEVWPRRRGSGTPAAAGASEPELVGLPRSWAAAVALLALGSLACAWLFATDFVPRRAALAACAAAFAANGWVAFRVRRAPPRAATGGEVAQLGRPRRAAAAAAALLFVGALVATTVAVREDPDDMLYISEALALQNAPAMAIEQPNHRGEGLPANILYVWQAFELWGGLLARASGTHPLILFRTLFAPLVLVLAACCYLEIFRSILPRGWIACALLVTIAYFTFGMTSHWTANNYLLPRPAQGKTWVVHVAVPVLVLIASEFMRRPRPSTWLLLLLVCFASLGFAPFSVYLIPSAMAALLLAYAALWPGRATVLRGAIAATALLPLLGFGRYLASQVDDSMAESVADRVAAGRWRDEFFFGHLNFSEGGGALELFPLVALPLAALLLRRREQLFYPVAFTLALFATALNPLVFPLLAGSWTGFEGYKRLFWLVPYPFLLGILAAGLVRASAAARRPAWVGAAVLAGFLLAMPLTGGSFVFGPGNPSGGDSPAPYMARNAYKMPEDLRRLAEVLARGPHGPETRILCSMRTASHLGPLVHGFDFVYARKHQTRSALKRAGRAEEATERSRLGGAFLRGRVAPDEAAALLAEHKTWYVVQERDSEAIQTALRSAAFQLVGEFGAYRLWARGGLGREEIAEPPSQLSAE